MKRSWIKRKPTRVKGPSLNHPDRTAEPKPKKRKRIAQRSAKGRKDDLRLKEHKKKFPDSLVDPVSGRPFEKADSEFHHPAGRSGGAFLFVIPLPHDVHARIHDYPKWAESVGLLLPGRCAKKLTRENAWKLLELVPWPASMRLAIQLWEESESD